MNYIVCIFSISRLFVGLKNIKKVFFPVNSIVEKLSCWNSLRGSRWGFCFFVSFYKFLNSKVVQYNLSYSIYNFVSQMKSIPTKETTSVSS